MTAALKAALAEPPEDNTPVSTLDEVKKQEELQQEQLKQRATIEADVKYMAELPATVEKLSKHLGDTAAAIVARIQAQPTTEGEKVAALKYNLATAFFEDEKNMETLSPTLRSRVEAFRVMDASTSAGMKLREEHAPAVYEAVEQVIHTKEVYDRHQATLGNAGAAATSDAHKKYLERNFAGSLRREAN